MIALRGLRGLRSRAKGSPASPGALAAGLLSRSLGPRGFLDHRVELIGREGESPCPRRHDELSQDPFFPAGLGTDSPDVIPRELPETFEGIPRGLFVPRLLPSRLRLPLIRCETAEESSSSHPGESTPPVQIAREEGSGLRPVAGVPRVGDGLGQNGASETAPEDAEIVDVGRPVHRGERSTVLETGVPGGRYLDVHRVIGAWKSSLSFRGRELAGVARVSREKK